MSRLIEKLREVGHIRTATTPGARPNSGLAQNRSTPQTVVVSPGIAIAFLVCWVISVVVAIGIAVSGGTTSSAVLKDLSKVIRKQSDRIKGLETALSSADSLQKKFSQNMDDKFKSLNSQVLKTDKRFVEISSSQENLSREISSLKVTTRNIVDKYIDLSGEIKTLKLLAVPESAANTAIGTGRSGYGKNN